MAEEAAGVRTLQRIARSDHRLRVVLTASDATAPGVSVASAAAELGVPTLPADRVRDPDLADDLRERGVDVLLNVHSLHLVRPEVLDAPRVGALNLHPGPLPEVAGLNAPSWAVARGHEQHGVTLHWMEPGIDTGDVVDEVRFPITPDDTALTVAVRCVARGQELVDRLLGHLEDGVVPRRPQDHTARRYYGRGVPSTAGRQSDRRRRLGGDDAHGGGRLARHPRARLRANRIHVPWTRHGLDRSRQHEQGNDGSVGGHLRHHRPRRDRVPRAQGRQPHLARDQARATSSRPTSTTSAGSSCARRSRPPA